MPEHWRPVRSDRGLCRGKDSPPDRSRQFNGREIFTGIKVIIPGFIQDAHQSAFRRGSVGNRDVDLASLERGFIAIVLETDHQVPR